MFPGSMLSRLLVRLVSKVLLVRLVLLARGGLLWSVAAAVKQ